MMTKLVPLPSAFPSPGPLFEANKQFQLGMDKGTPRPGSTMSERECQWKLPNHPDALRSLDGGLPTGQNNCLPEPSQTSIVLQQMLSSELQCILIFV